MLKEKIENKIGFITLDVNPENTLSPASIGSIIDLCEKLDSSEDVHVIFMSSARARYFSNGIDPLAIREKGIMACFEALVDLVTRLYAIKKPMVACVNGYALAGGAVLGILADYRFADQNLKYAFNEILMGLTMSQMLFDIIKNAVGPFHAKHLSQTGKAVRAGEALSMGLVDQIFEPHELYKRSLNFAKRLSGLSSPSLCHLKKVSRKEILESSKKNQKQELQALKKYLTQPVVKENFQRLLERSQKRNQV